MEHFSFIRSLFLAIIILFTACGDKNDEEEILKKSDEKTIFEFAVGDLKGNIDEEKKNITIAFPYGTDVTKLIPTLHISEKATVSPKSGHEVDLTNPVKYIVTAEDFSQSEYTVTGILAKSNEAQILTFVFTRLTPKVEAVIDEEEKTITAVVPFGTNLKTLIPDITYKGSSILPVLGHAVNFENSILYKVTAEDGTEVKYQTEVKVSVSSEAELIEFAFNGIYPKVKGVLNTNTKIVGVDVPHGTNLTNLVPTITFKGHKITPESGVAKDFSNQVFYTIEAQDKTKYEFSVMVFVNPFEPIITSVNRTKFTNGDQMVLNGKFADTGNSIELRNSTNAPVFPTVIKESNTSITTTIPSLAQPGEYTMTVKSYNGNVRYTEKITIVDSESLNPKIVSITPASLISGIINKVTFKTENMTDLEGISAKFHYVFDGKDYDISESIKREDSTDPNTFYIINSNWNPKTYKFYLEHNGKKSNEVTLEIKVNPYPSPQIISANTYTPTEGETITLSGKNFKDISDFETYIQIIKRTGPSSGAQVRTTKATVIDDNTLTFSLPFIKNISIFPEEVPGRVQIQVIANGRLSSHFTDFDVKQK